MSPSDGVLLDPPWPELASRFAGRVGVVIPALDEADNLPHVLRRMPREVCGTPTAVLVVDDGSRDGTAQVARAEGAAVARHPVNRGGGAAMRTGFELLVRAGARAVVTMDADGQHLPEEMPRVLEPVLSGAVDVAYGSRVLGSAEPNAFARELGIAFFNRLVSVLTRTHVTDCSNSYRAIRTDVLPSLVLRQQQFHTSEFLIETLRRGLRTTEVPITVTRRLSGTTKKPTALRYGFGFARAIVQTWLRRPTGEGAGDPIPVPRRVAAPKPAANADGHGSGTGSPADSHEGSVAAQVGRR